MLLKVFRTAFVDIDLYKQFPTSNSFRKINSIFKNKVVLQFNNVKWFIRVNIFIYLTLKLVGFWIYIIPFALFTLLRH